MIYLLILLLTGFFSWPYYHRMRTFGFPWRQAYTVALVPSILISLGLVHIIFLISQGMSFGGYPNLPDVISKWTFGILWVILGCYNSYLFLTGLWYTGDMGGEGDGIVFFLSVIIAFILALCATDVIIFSILALS